MTDNGSAYRSHAFKEGAGAFLALVGEDLGVLLRLPEKAESPLMGANRPREGAGKRCLPERERTAAFQGAAHWSDRERVRADVRPQALTAGDCSSKPDVKEVGLSAWLAMRSHRRTVCRQSRASENTGRRENKRPTTGAVVVKRFRPKSPRLLGFPSPLRGGGECCGAGDWRRERA